MQDFIERHSTKIKGVISCFGRIVLTGTIPGICYAQGMSAFLTAQNIRIFDFTQWAEPLREEIRANAEKIAHDNGLKIEFIRNVTGRLKYHQYGRVQNQPVNFSFSYVVLS